MRLAAQEKLGFYPASQEAIARLLRHLRAGLDRPHKTLHLIDPCAGQGAAIRQIAEGLGVPEHHVYCVELDEGRGQAVRGAMPKSHVLAPCSIHSAAITPQSFGLVYVNPPFDDELGGGGREEESFVNRAYALLAAGGVMALVAPYATFAHLKMKSLLSTHFRDAGFYRFPNTSYQECVFLGVKRPIPIPESKAYGEGLLFQMNLSTYAGVLRGSSDVDLVGEPGRTGWHQGYPGGRETETRAWEIPATWKPARFFKAAYTPDELIRAVTESPLGRLLVAAEEPPIKQPPLPLGRGHIAMLLASGALNGLVEALGILLHVVRGTASKSQVYNEEASDYTISEDSKTATVKDVYLEEISLSVRAVDETGQIYTFTGAGKSTGGELEYELSAEDAKVIAKLKNMTRKNGSTIAEEANALREVEGIKAKYRLAAKKKKGA